ncbi:hypothetical protein COV16_01485 [Candidatus Woesearchaeota archaeon CG10_big_fil_rev_8_21_14_0_10_34_8]|nr:MAG: hypothetical protein COV16_01485 [Candidatus Woesearchaeota archaeon CG10_big_fil_rev_8_21_14_0_10_34_8]
MARKHKKVNLHNTNLYLLAIVAIVAVVGIVVLVLNAGGGAMDYSSEESVNVYDEDGNLIGQAFYSNWFKKKKTQEKAPCCGANGICWC